MSTIKANQVLNLDGDRIGSVVVDSIANMKNLNTEIEANATVELLGYYSKGDGGGGTFYWDSTSIEDDNGGTIIQATGVVDGRWIRNYSGAVNVKWFAIDDSLSNNTNIDLDISINDGDYFYYKPKHNSYFGMTLNTKPIKILDINATEESQWTHNAYNDAVKNELNKTNIYRTCFQNMISADIEYKFIYRATGDFYEILVDKIYKHAFLGCGFGNEITELADALNFVMQFSIAKYMDPLFQNMNSATEYYPNKAQITIAISSGTLGSPVTSVMNKPVRIGENNLNGIEIVNNGRYNGNTDPDTCIIDFSGVTLGNDDLACLNIWKTDLGEIHGITFKYHGDFSISNQSVIRYNRTEGRFKACIIDVEGCTFTGMPGGVTALYADRSIESFDCTIKCPTAANYLIAVILSAQTSFGSLIVTGNPRIFARVGGNISFEAIDIQGTPEYLFTNREEASVSFLGTGRVAAADLREHTSGVPKLTFHLNTTYAIGGSMSPAPQVDIQYVYDDAYTQNSNLTINSDTSRVNFNSAWDTLSGAIGKFQGGGNGVDLSGNGTTGHWSVAVDGALYPITDVAYNIGYSSKKVNALYVKDIFSALPTSDPAVSGQLWNDAGTVKVST